jgi:hypothetical protein
MAESLKNTELLNTSVCWQAFYGKQHNAGKCKIASWSYLSSFPANTKQTQHPHNQQSARLPFPNATMLHTYQHCHRESKAVVALSKMCSKLILGKGTMEIKFNVYSKT